MDANLEKEEGYHGGWMSGNLWWETKGTKDGWRIEEGREECEDCEDVKLGQAEQFRRVEIVPMTEFVRCE